MNERKKKGPRRMAPGGAGEAKGKLSGPESLQAECDRLKAALREAEERLAVMFDAAPDAYFISDTHGHFVDGNRAAEELSGYSREELAGMGFPDLRNLPAGQAETVRTFLLENARGLPTGPHELILRRKDGTEVPGEVRTVPVRIHEGDGILAIVRDITERHREKDLLIENRRMLSTLMGNLPGMAYRCANDPRWTMEFISDGCLELTGYLPEDIVGNSDISFEDLILEEDRKWVRDAVELGLAHQRPFQMVYRIRTASSGVKWVWEKGMGIFGDDGGLQALEGFVTDISDRKRAEEALRISLEEKEVLLREVHHRVKNNLQVVVSLLNLQSQSVSDPRVREIFKESRNRIRSMALVHERLYQSSDLSRVDFAEYIKRLTTHLFHSYGLDAGRIEIGVEAGDARLDINTAVPVGLIINELVSNAIKHAFPAGAHGRIAVGLERLEGGTFRLTVSDDGTGFPGDLDFRKTESLGMQIVTMLADQLDAEIALEREAGTRFTLIFGEARYRKRA